MLLSMFCVTYAAPLFFDALPHILPDLQIPTWLFRILFVIPVILMVVLYRRQIRRNQKDMEGELGKLRYDRAKLAIEQVLHLAVKGLRASEDETCRANIMLIKNNRLAIQFHYGMDSTRDLDIQLEKNQGCAGQAWGCGDQRCADLRKIEATGRPSWNLTPQQEAVTDHLGAILSTPIFDPQNPQEVVGVLNIDSELSLQKAGFLKEEISEQASEYANMFGAWL